jgi:hypothetical protein
VLSPLRRHPPVIWPALPCRANAGGTPAPLPLTAVAFIEAPQFPFGTAFRRPPSFVIHSVQGRPPMQNKNRKQLASINRTEPPTSSPCVTPVLRGLFHCGSRLLK